MYRGKIVALGAPEELKRSLTSHHLMDLESSDPLESMKALRGVPGILDSAVFGGGLHVAVDDPAAAAPRIREALAARGIAIRHLEPVLPSMEDVFVAMIEQEERRAA